MVLFILFINVLNNTKLTFEIKQYWNYIGEESRGDGSPANLHII